MVTIKDVARLAGVSISTVSRVINDSKPVSKEVREKVQEVIEETGYRPNDVARSLVTRRSYLIGVIVNDLTSFYVSEMVKGVEEVGKMYNFDILLCSSYYDKEAQIKYLQLLDRKQAEGLIMIGYKFEQEIFDKIKKLNKPTVYFTRDVKDKNVNHVKIDAKAAMYEMTKYIIKNGHKKILYAYDFKDDTTHEKEKMKGIENAIKEDKDASWKKIDAKGRKYKEGYSFGEKLSEEKIKYTTIMCSNDEIAMGLTNSLFDNNVKVPEDVSVVGYGDYREGNIIRPKLTTVGEPYYDIGAVLIRNLIKEIEGEEQIDRKINLPFSIVKRDSLKSLV